MPQHPAPRPRRARRAGFRAALAAADVLHAPVANRREVAREVANDLNEFAQFVAVATREVVGRQQVERDDTDVGFVAPPQKLDDLLGPRSVAVGGGAPDAQSSPATIAIENHGDMARVSRVGQLPTQAAHVELIQQAATPGSSRRSHTATVVHRADVVAGIQRAPRIVCPPVSSRHDLPHRTRAHLGRC